MYAKPTDSGSPPTTCSVLATTSSLRQNTQMETNELMDLARAGNTSALCEWLEGGGDIQTTNERGDSLLLLAVYYGRLETAATLIQRGADVDARNLTGQRALAGACFKGFKPVVELLLDAGAAINEEQPGQKTPLMYAASYEHRAIVKLLLDRGADPAVRVDGKSALDMARDNLAHDVVPMLESTSD